MDPSLAVPFKEIGNEANRALADRVADASIQVAIGDADSLLLPAQRLGQKGPLCFLIRPHTTYNDPTQAPLETAFLRAFPDGEYIEINPESVEDDLGPLLDRAGRHSAVIAAAVVKPAAWHRFGLLHFQKRFIRDLADRYPIWLAALGSPLLLADFQDVPAGICVYSDVEPSMKALVRFLKAREAEPSINP